MTCVRIHVSVLLTARGTLSSITTTTTRDAYAVGLSVHAMRSTDITMTIRPPTSSLDVEVWILTLTILWMLQVITATMLRTLQQHIHLYRSAVQGVSGSTESLHALPQRTSSGSEPWMASWFMTLRPRSYEHSIDCGYATLRGTQQSIPVHHQRPGGHRDAACSPESWYYLAGARGLPGLPIHRLTR